MAQLSGRHALVTGGGRGIGRAVAAALSAAGAAVTVLGRQQAALDDAVAKGHARDLIVADVTDPAAVSAGIERAEADNGPFDILVANAGAAETAPFGKTAPEQFRRLFELNVLGIVNCAQILLPGMVARKSGRIVAVASTAGLKGYGYVSAYVTSKHAVVGLVRSLAIETAKTGVTVNAVCPSFTDTDLVRESVAAISKKTGRSEQDVIAQYVKDVPMARLIKPEEVAAAVLYLSSDAASAVTGTAMTVAGGEI
ncbi:SDR family NAD(P)-dependent oxidoreductase [Pseudorhodoplanes sp.]|uniref:SDR family NAD(P)-dependent oxidoreductase n=1 Tax=Pseudorhodoplanes sp. TaxID=1934341 RepID=UPI0039191DC8